MQKPSWEAKNALFIQNIPRTLRNPMFHHRVQESSPPVSTTSQTDPLHDLTLHSLNIYFIIIPFQLRTGLQSGTYFQVYPPKSRRNYASMPCEPQALPISLFDKVAHKMYHHWKPCY